MGGDVSGVVVEGELVEGSGGGLVRWEVEFGGSWFECGHFGDLLLDHICLTLLHEILQLLPLLIMRQKPLPALLTLCQPRPTTRPLILPDIIRRFHLGIPRRARQHILDILRPQRNILPHHLLPMHLQLSIYLHLFLGGDLISCLVHSELDQLIGGQIDVPHLFFVLTVRLDRFQPPPLLEGGFGDLLDGLDLVGGGFLQDSKGFLELPDTDEEVRDSLEFQCDDIEDDAALLFGFSLDFLVESEVEEFEEFSDDEGDDVEIVTEFEDLAVDFHDAYQVREIALRVLMKGEVRIMVKKHQIFTKKTVMICRCTFNITSCRFPFIRIPTSSLKHTVAVCCENESLLVLMHFSRGITPTRIWSSIFCLERQCTKTSTQALAQAACLPEPLYLK